MDKYYTLVIFIAGISFGVSGGKYYGQTEIFQQLLEDKIECSLTVNPITAAQMK